MHRLWSRLQTASTFRLLLLLMTVLSSPPCLAAPSLTTPVATSVGTNMATLVLESSGAGSGYVTLLTGSGIPCGSGAQVAAGLSSTGSLAPYHGSLSLNANSAAGYSLRNLLQGTVYTACFTADSPTGANLNASPASVNLTTATAPSFTGAQWRTMGGSGFSAGTASFTSLAFAPDGTPVVAYGDWTNGYRATVMRFINGAWTPLGSAGLSAGGVQSTQLVFAPDGTPHLIYTDFANGLKATLMKFTNGSWSAVGSAGFTAGQANYPSLAFAPDGTPYVAYQDSGHSAKATVMRFAAGAWSLVGSAGFSAGQADYTSLAISAAGTPYLAYRDLANGARATVMQYSGGSWSVVGSVGFSAGQADSTTLVIAPNGTPYLAYTDFANGQKATVMQFNGSIWSAVGSAGFSSGQALGLTVAIAPDGNPTVAYKDAVSGYKATVMTFSGSSWGVVKSAGFSAGEAYYPSLAYAPDGTPYLALMDSGNSGRATVMRLLNPPTIGGTPITSGSVGNEYRFTPTAGNAESFSVSGTLPPGLDFDTLTGTLSGTPTTAGTYSNIVITASNSVDSASLPAFTITISAVYGLSVVVQGSGSGVVHTSPGTDLACSGGCGQNYIVDTLVTLTAAANSGSQFTSWSGCDATAGTQCTVTMNSARTVTANFTLVSTAIKVGSSYYTSIGAAYAAAGSGSEISLQTADFYEPLDFSMAKTVTLKGGYSTDYSSVTGQSIIHGSLTVTSGTLIVNNVIII